ncbi:hypothetical protein Bca4012_000465 [Brassica carinata]
MYTNNEDNGDILKRGCLNFEPYDQSNTVQGVKFPEARLLQQCMQDSVSKSQIRNDLSIQVDDIIFQAHKVVYLHQERHASLEDANVCDILIPNFRNEDKGASSLEVDNIDVVHRILERLETNASVASPQGRYCLAESAQDPCLSITKFQVLAEMLLGNAMTASIEQLVCFSR